MATLSLDKIEATILDSGKKPIELCRKAGVYLAFLSRTKKSIRAGRNIQLGVLFKLSVVLGCDWRDLVEETEITGRQEHMSP